VIAALSGEAAVIKRVFGAGSEESATRGSCRVANEF